MSQRIHQSNLSSLAKTNINIQTHIVTAGAAREANFFSNILHHKNQLTQFLKGNYDKDLKEQWSTPIKTHKIRVTQSVMWITNT